MNILVLTSVYPQPGDKKDIVTPTVKYYCDMWSKLGHRVVVIHNNSKFPCLYYYVPQFFRYKLSSSWGFNFPNKESRIELKRNENGVSIYRYPMKKFFPHANFSKKRIEKQVEKIVITLEKEKMQPDIIIGHWVNPQLELLESLSKIYKNAKTSLVFHGDCSKKNLLKFDILSRIKSLSAIGCRNFTYAKYVQKVLNLKKTPFLCYSGIPDEQVMLQKEYLAKHMSLCEENTFLYVGRLIKYKNVDTIIKALAASYPDKNFKFYIVGEGAEYAYLKNLAKNLGISDNIIFYGQKPREEVFNIMRESKFFIMVSDNETFGMVYVEAMLAGCITIASKHGGIDGVILNGQNGFLSKQGDKNELVEVITNIKNMDNEDILKIRNNSINTAMQLSDSNLAKKYLDDIVSWHE